MLREASVLQFGQWALEDVGQQWEFVRLGRFTKISPSIISKGGKTRSFACQESDLRSQFKQPAVSLDTDVH